MAQSGFTPIKLYLSTTAAAAPLAANLAPGELAINNNDGKLFYEDSSGVVQVIATKAGASGDVVGPASATDNAVARFDLTTGKIIQNSVVTIADTTGNMAGVGTLSSGAITSSALTSGRVPYAGTAGLIQDAAALTFDGTILSSTRFAGALNGTVGATTPSTGAFTTLSGTGQLTLTKATDYNLYASGAGANYMAGSLGIGTTALTAMALRTSKSITGGTSAWGVRYDGAVLSDVTAAAYLYSTYPSTQAAAFTLGNLIHYQAGQGSIGAGSSIGNQYGFYAGSDLVGATTNIGYYSDIPSGTGRWNFYATGTAANVFVGTTSIGGVVGSESLRVTPVASAVNYVNVQGNITTGWPSLTASGSDTNIGLTYITKGTGGHSFFTGATSQFFIANTASAVNYLQVAGAATASAPNLQATGTDTNVAMTFSTKGTFGYGFYTNSFAQQQFVIAHTASAVNYLQVTGSATGVGSPSLQVQGSDTNIILSYYTKGTGTHNFVANNAIQFLIGNTASAVNYLQVTGAATLGAPTLSVQGSDTNINAIYLTKGTGNHYIGSGVNGYQFAVVTTPTPAVNYLYATGAATGVAPSMSAAGSDTNIDLALTPQGTGVVQYGTYTAGVVAQAGYISIKDAGGTTRRLLVG